MKFLRFGLILVSFFSSLVYGDEVITIAASPVPHAEILKQIQPILKSEGIDLQIKEFDDYVQPNLLVAQKQLDANFFQHIPYLNTFNKEHGTNLIVLTKVEVEPMGLYISNNPALKAFTATKKVNLLPKNLLVGIPNDATNEGRALQLLEKNGFIKIKTGVIYPTKQDITLNPYNIQIKELDPAMLPRALLSNQLSLAVINSNFALEAKLNPLKDAIFIEGKNSAYVNIVAIRPDEANEPKMKKLEDALQSVQLKNFILNQYKGAVIPAF